MLHLPNLIEFDSLEIDKLPSGVSEIDYSEVVSGRPPNAPEGWKEFAFQTRMKEQLIDGLQLGVKRGRIISPTGSGKTTMTCDVMTQLETPQLVLAPSVAAAERFKQELRSRGENPLTLNSKTINRLPQARFIVATGQALMPKKNSPGLLAQIPNDFFKYLWVDEAHKFFGACMGQVPDHFDAPHIYITATPDTKRNSLADKAPFLFGEIKYKELIENFGYPKRRLFQHTVKGEDWDKVRIVASEAKYEDEDNGNVKGLNMPARYGVLNRIFKNVVTPQCPAIAFMPSIKSSRYFIKHFVDPDPELKGKIKLVHGGMSARAREKIRLEMEAGTLLGVLTTSAWAESVDITRVKHVIMADNVSVPWLETQRIGRGTRKHPDKEGEVWIHDISGFKANGGRRASSLVRNMKPKLDGRRFVQGTNLDDEDAKPIDPRVLAALNVTTTEIPLSDWAYEVDFSILRDNPELCYSLLKRFANTFNILPIELILNAKDYLENDVYILCKFPDGDEACHMYFRDLWSFMELFRLKESLADHAFEDVEKIAESIGVEANEVTESIVWRAKEYFQQVYTGDIAREDFVCTEDWEHKVLMIIQDEISVTDQDIDCSFPYLISRGLSASDIQRIKQEKDHIHKICRLNGFEMLVHDEFLCIYQSDIYDPPAIKWNTEAMQLKTTDYCNFWTEIEDELKPIVSEEFFNRVKANVLSGEVYLKIHPDEAARFVNDIHELISLKKSEGFKDNRATSCFCDEEGNWIIPLHFLRCRKSYDWNEPKEAIELPNYEASQTSLQKIWGHVQELHAANDYHEHGGAIRFEFANEDIYEAHLSHPMLRRVCIMEDLVRDLRSQGINASWAYQKRYEKAYDTKYKIQARPERMILCIAPDGSDIQIEPDFISAGAQLALMEALPLPKTKYSKGFLAELDQVTLQAVKGIASLDIHKDKYPGSDAALARNWYVKNIDVGSFKYDQVDQMQYALMRLEVLSFNGRTDQEIWEGIMSRFQDEGFRKEVSVDEFAKYDEQLKYSYKFSLEEIRFLNEYEWLFKMYGLEFAHYFKNSDYNGSYRKSYQSSSKHSHVQAPAHFKIKKLAIDKADFASPPGEPYTMSDQAEHWLARIHDAIINKKTSVRLRLRANDGNKLLSLQNAFYAHGVFGLTLRPISVGKTWVEVSLKGLETIVNHQQKSSIMMGRHTSLQTEEDHEVILRHGKAIGVRSSDGRIEFRREGQSLEAALKTAVERVRSKTQEQCIHSVEIDSEADPENIRRILTVTSHDASHEKTLWRSHLIEQCPPGILNSSGNFVMLPAWGHEADKWLDAGVHESQLILVDRDEENIRHLRRRYPYARVIQADIRRKRTWDTIRRFGPTASVSIDPYAGITKGFIDPLSKGMQLIETDGLFYFALNLQGKIRGAQSTQAYFEEVRRTYKLPTDATAIELAWRKCAPKNLPLVERPFSGRYEGDSANTIMNFAMGTFQGRALSTKR